MDPVEKKMYNAFIQARARAQADGKPFPYADHIAYNLRKLTRVIDNTVNIVNQVDAALPRSIDDDYITFKIRKSQYQNLPKWIKERVIPA